MSDHVLSDHTRVKIFRRRLRDGFRKSYWWVCPHCDLDERTTCHPITPKETT